MLASGTAHAVSDRTRRSASAGCAGWLEADQSRYPPYLGSAVIVLLPAEALVQYQLRAQEARASEDCDDSRLRRVRAWLSPDECSNRGGLQRPLSTCEAALRRAISVTLASPVR